MEDGGVQAGVGAWVRGKVVQKAVRALKAERWGVRLGPGPG